MANPTAARESNDLANKTRWLDMAQHSTAPHSAPHRRTKKYSPVNRVIEGKAKSVRVGQLINEPVR